VFNRKLILAYLLFSPIWAYAQVEPAANGTMAVLTVGGYYSYFDADYAGNKLSGIGAYIDWSPSRAWRLGAEAEGRWLIFNAPNDFNQYTYLIGPRYRFPVSHRIQPYAKMLLGSGVMTFPYRLGHGSYFAMAPGGGVDLVVKKRWILRADYEYQIWPNAPGIPGIQSSALKPHGVSAGVSYRVF
jgi:opacity protein-like surface antigen